MGNSIPIILYTILAAVTVALIIHSAARLKERRLTPSMLFLFVAVLIWQILAIAYFFVQSVSARRLLFDLKLPFIAVSMVALLLFVMHFYSMDAYITPNIVAILFVIPTITFFLCITTNSHNYIREYVEVLSPAPHTIVKSGMWFWFHTAFCYILALISFLIILVQHRKMPSAFRAPSRFLLIGIIISLVFSYFYVTDRVLLALDPTLIAMSVTNFLLFIATQQNQSVDFLVRARSDVFNHLPEGVFVLDQEDYVRSWNPAALAYIDNLGLDREEKSFKTILRTIAQKSVSQVRLSLQGAGKDYFMDLNTDEEKVINMKEREIFESPTTDLTRLAILTDVTWERGLTGDLEKETGQDALTGLLTKQQLYRLIPLIDTPDNWPLSVLVGDLDYLGHVNHHYGYQQGDLFIRAAADIVSNASPSTSLVGRIDGGEFMALIPSLSSQRAAELVTTIGDKMKEAHGFAFPMSMSFGFAIKQKSDQEIEQIVHTAEMALVANKAFMRTHISQEL